MEKNKQRIILSLGILIILALSAVVVMEISSQKKEAERKVVNNYVPENIESEKEAESDAISTDFEESEFREEVPVGVKVPAVDEEVPEELKDIVAVPHEIVEAKPGNSSARIFNIKAEGGKFIPSQIIANYNEIVQIRVNAIDADYDFIFPAYGMKQNILMGETKSLDFQALMDGRFVYYCELCGGLESEAKGEIIVVK